MRLHVSASRRSARDGPRGKCECARPIRQDSTAPSRQSRVHPHGRTASGKGSRDLRNEHGKGNPAPFGSACRVPSGATICCGSADLRLRGGRKGRQFIGNHVLQFLRRTLFVEQRPKTGGTAGPFGPAPKPNCNSTGITQHADARDPGSDPSVRHHTDTIASRRPEAARFRFPPCRRGAHRTR